ncbi:MAG: ribosome maturation factor RimM [Bacteroidota bacterium]
MLEDYIKIGRTGKAHGLHGELKISIEDEFLEDLDYLDVLFIARKSSQPLPFFLETLRGPSIAKFEEVDDRETAQQFQHLDLFARRSDFQRDLDELPIKDHLEYGFLINFSVSDVDLGNLGTIVDVEEFPQQEMLIISHEGKEYLVPATEAYFTQLDKTAKHLILHLPEGLLDL